MGLCSRVLGHSGCSPLRELLPATGPAFRGGEAVRRIRVVGFLTAERAVENGKGIADGMSRACPLI